MMFMNELKLVTHYLSSHVSQEVHHLFFCNYGFFLIVFNINLPEESQIIHYLDVIFEQYPDSLVLLCASNTDMIDPKRLSIILRQMYEKYHSLAPSFQRTFMM